MGGRGLTERGEGSVSERREEGKDKESESLRER